MTFLTCRIYFEQSKLYRAAGQEERALKALNSLFRLSRQNVHNYIEYALDYAAASQYEAAIELISFALDKQESSTYPMVFYYLSWFYKQSGQSEAALTYGKKAALAIRIIASPTG